jgi:hypothetical protein
MDNHKCYLYHLARRAVDEIYIWRIDPHATCNCSHLSHLQPSYLKHLIQPIK